MQFVGITRFNLVTSPTLRHFNSTKDLTLEAAKRLVFEPDRLATKLATFESFCLPTYRTLAEQDERSHGLVLISHDLPEPYRHRLAEMCRSVPRLQILEFADDDSIEGRVGPVLADLADGERLFSYRYDDDDVLARGFLQQVEKICEDAPDGTVVSMNRGFVVARLGDDSFGIYERKDPLNAYGLGAVVDGAQPRSIFDFGRHDRLSAPVAHEVDTPSWIAFRHGLNDSKLNGTELNRLKRLVENQRTGDQLAELLSERFPHLEPDALQRVPELPIHENLDAIARYAIRRTRALESALAAERKKVARHESSATELERTKAALARTRNELRTTRAALARTRTRLRDVTESRSFRLARAIADTRSPGALMTLPRRLRAAGRRQSASRS